MTISQEYIVSKYDLIKSHAKQNWRKGKYSASGFYIKKAAHLMYHLNTVYSDPELDDLIIDMSKKLIFDESKCIKKQENRVTFFDSFGLSYRGLAWIYIKACIDLGYEVQYITYQNNATNPDFYPLHQYLKSNRVSIRFIDNGGLKKQSNAIVKSILDFSPQAALFHGTPFDIPALIAFSFMEGKAERYLINLTDHAFWLGTKSFDTYIEFRDFGYTISKQHRGISEDKLTCLPFYPIQAITNTPLGSLPFDHPKRRFIVSGGAPYKIAGSDVYPNLVRRILDNNPDVGFLFLGTGKAESIDEMVEEYKGRLVHLGERVDLLEIVKLSELYVSTYPLAGGLMTQIAAIAHKVPVAIIHPGHDATASLLLNRDVLIDYASIDEAIAEIQKLLDDSDYRFRRGEELSNSVMTPQLFAEGLEDILESGVPYPMSSIEVDICKFRQPYLDRCKSLSDFAKTVTTKEDLRHMTIFDPITWLGLGRKMIDKISCFEI